MKAKDCKRFDSCSAPLCPLDVSNLKNSIWYADEVICPLREFCKTTMVNNQNKIARRTRDLYTYYTKKMLEQKCIIRNGITGIDPDKELGTSAKDEIKWITVHKGPGELSEEKRTELSERGRKALKDFHQRDKVMKKQVENVVL